MLPRKAVETIRRNSDELMVAAVVTSRILDRVAAKLGRRLYEVPVGFKWFVAGLLDGSLCFVGEESAGASFVRLVAESAWFAARPSGTEAIYKIYAESLRGPVHLARVLE